MHVTRWQAAGAALLAFGIAASAGNLDAPAAPTSAASAMVTLEDLYRKIDSQGAAVSPRTGAFTEPAQGPTTGTMHTLNEILALVTNRAPVMKTGQTVSHLSGDDGATQIGVTWPSPRFSLMADTNCVRDNLTGLIWARNMNFGSFSWSDGVAFCDGLEYGGTNDWRMPNILELNSLVDYSRNGAPSLPTGHLFTNLVTANVSFHTSTTDASNSGQSLFLSFWYSKNGTIGANAKSSSAYVWPVRGGSR